ncbi:nucleophile aminohydrolase [Lactarius hengduanensis]|nr:nucleophile aminohydrolase [Lactarius hengduanensis]
MEIDTHLGCAMSGLTADARTINHAFTYDERIKAVCDLALRFGESVHDEDAMMSRPYHTDPSGTFVRYDAKAIAQSELQDKWHSQMSLTEGQVLVLRVLKQVMEEKLDQHNVQLAQVTTDKGFHILDERS